MWLWRELHQVWKRTQLPVNHHCNSASQETDWRPAWRWSDNEPIMWLCLLLTGLPLWMASPSPVWYWYIYRSLGMRSGSGKKEEIGEERARQKKKGGCVWKEWLGLITPIRVALMVSQRERGRQRERRPVIFVGQKHIGPISENASVRLMRFLKSKNEWKEKRVCKKGKEMKAKLSEWLRVKFKAGVR